ncbi:hypothetical protein BP5796_02109 [Coleophoma crateriformis]|uniref:Serine hydrolase domain-containing protein n=1 Tax=Coleophoma crateriformis TaxID=565419 RepID=A0A3D8SXE4_9HELO|nr:hypothetical protein BP5796_02109 [Coleophoma crateriformis]
MSTDQAASEQLPRKLKILMLHGYTQDGTLFHSRTKALEKILKKAFPSTNADPLNPFPGGVELLYPTGPVRLQPEDIPGYDARTVVEGSKEKEAYGWWKHDPTAEAYAGLDETFTILAETIRNADGIDGVVGFSQGAAVASFVASLLEPGRESAFVQNVGGMVYPADWVGVNQGRELKFAVSYSGFCSTIDQYRSFYEPKIRTPFLHVIGSSDMIVEESRSLALAEACENSKVLYHPGAHFVPIGKDMAGEFVSFVKETCIDKTIEGVDEKDMSK